jgi:hypothetical protein
MHAVEKYAAVRQFGLCVLTVGPFQHRIRSAEAHFGDGRGPHRMDKLKKRFVTVPLSGGLGSHYAKLGKAALYDLADLPVERNRLCNSVLWPA